MKTLSMSVIAGLLATLIGFFLSVPTAQADDPHCVQNGTLHAYICAYHQPGTGGGVYLADVLFENWYYWHPSNGDIVVDETYAKGMAPGYVKEGTPGVVFSGHRTIHFANATMITDRQWLNDFPHDSRPPASCSGAPCTRLQQKSAMDFQHAMNADQINHSF